MKHAFKRIAIGTIFVAAAGYIAGVLTAPKSGKETRDEIKNTARNTASETERRLKKAHTDLATLLNQARERSMKVKGDTRKQIEQAMESAGLVKEKVRVLLSAVHEGDTDDKDLKKAIADATKAIDRLKTYLKS